MRDGLCSMDWDAARLPAWGTAKAAQVIVVVEVAGSWGGEASADSGLPEPEGAACYLIRSPGRHAEEPPRRAVFVSGDFGGQPWLVGGQLTREGAVAFLQGDVADPNRHETFGLAPRDEPVLLVCTNGRRDACCAVRARPVALAAHAAAPQRVWEVSHIGGHRFAPTAIHLPSGQTFGRLSEEDGVRLALADGAAALSHLFTPTKHRGRVDLPPAAQVAETWWRERRQEWTLAPVTGIGTPELVGSEWIVPMPDGTSLAVASNEGPDLRDSCAKAPKPSSTFAAAQRA